MMLKKIFRKSRNLLTSFSRDKMGNVALMTAMWCVPLFGMVGIAIDYSTAVAAKSKLDAAADAAATAAMVTAEGIIEGGGTMDWATSQAQALGAKAFAANAGSIAFTAVPIPTVTLDRTGQALTTKVSYSAQTMSNFGKLFGVNALSSSMTSVVQASLPTYINYYIVVDVSQSMGIGATQTDMNNLYARTGQYGNQSCVFGCHVVETGGTYSNEYLAHQIMPIITLRIDSAIAAIKDVITKAQMNAASVGNIQIGLYTMNQDPISGNVLNVITPPSSDYTGLNTLAGNISLGNNVAMNGGIGDTDFHDSLTSFNMLLPSGGDGSSPNTPMKYIFIITDGVNDVYCDNGVSNHCTGPFDPTICMPLRSKGTVGVIYTTYSPIYLSNNIVNGYDSTYLYLVAPFASSIPTNLKSCATSSSYYYEATDGPGIENAMGNLFATTLQLMHISQ